MSTHDSTHSNHPHDAIARAREWSEMTLDSARARRVAGIDHQETKAYDQARTALSRGGAPLLVGGPAGSGKSVLMSTLAGRAREEGILADEGLVLFVRGADIEDVGGLAGLLRQVADTLALPSGTWSSVEAMLGWFDEHLPATEDSGARLVLVLDAVDQAPRPAALLQALEESADAWRRHDWARLIVSARDMTLRAAGPSTDDSRWREVPGEDGARRPFVALQEWDDDTIRRIWEDATTSPWDALPSSWLGSLKSPLRLAMAARAHQRGGASALDGSRSIFEAYLDTVVPKDDGSRGALDELGAWLYEHRRPDIPVDLVERWVAQWDRDHASGDPRARQSPIDLLCGAGVLIPPETTGFTADADALSYELAHPLMLGAFLERELVRQSGCALEDADAEHWLAWLAATSATEQDETYLELVEVLRPTLLMAALADRKEPVDAAADLPDPVARRELLMPLVLIDGMHGAEALEWLERVGDGTPRAGRVADVVSYGLDDLLMQGFEAGALRHSHFVLSRLAAPTDALDERDRINASVVAAKTRAWILQNVGATQEAAALLELALQCARAASGETPDDPRQREQLAGALSRTGRLAVLELRRDDARRYFEEALSLRETNAAEGGTHARLCLARGLGDVAGLEYASSSPDAATEAHERALDLLRSLYAEMPHDRTIVRDLAVALGNAAFYKSRPRAPSDETQALSAEARALCEEASRLIDDLERHDPRDAEARENRFDLQAVCAQVWTGRDRGRWLEKAVESGERLLGEYPHRMDILEKTLGLVNDLVEARLSKRKASQASRWSRRAQALLEELSPHAMQRCGLVQQRGRAEWLAGEALFAENRRKAAWGWQKRALETFEDLVTRFGPEYEPTLESARAAFERRYGRA